MTVVRLLILTAGMPLMADIHGSIQNMVMDHECECNGHSQHLKPTLLQPLLASTRFLTPYSLSVLHVEVGVAWEWGYMNAQLNTISLYRFWYVGYFCYPSVSNMVQVCDHACMSWAECPNGTESLEMEKLLQEFVLCTLCMSVVSRKFLKALH